MSLQRVVWLADPDCSLQAPQAGIIRVTEPAHLFVELQSGEIDCVLVTGTWSEYSRTTLLDLLLGIDAAVPIIFWDAELTAREAVELVREGAYTCHSEKDCERVADSVDEACCEKRRKDGQRQASGTTEEWRKRLVGQSPAMDDVANTIRLVGPFRCTVLITGETGTGKEMAARALHSASPRAANPMVAVNCSAVPETLLEAELFGHVKGAFTGATNHRVGRFEQAHKSTIFLDEISEMPLELQAKLLRVLQERELQRLGSSETIKIDVRVIAASNTNLLEKVRQGKFREDLFYRLNVVPLEMPPLRKRLEDIPLLVEHFAAKLCDAEGIPLKTVTPRALERLSLLPWPGNVRQLENAVEKAIALSGYRTTLHAGDFGLTESHKLMPVETAKPPVLVPEQVDFATAVSQFERAILENALKRTGGNKTAAAELLGLKRTTLIMKLRGFEAAAIQVA